MSNVDNIGQAPIIPQGTQATVYGTPNFTPEQRGQANTVPTTDEVGKTAQANPDNAPEGSTFAELAAKKGFKSADDLAKSYAELESRQTKQSMELSELMKARQEGQVSQNQAQQIVSQVMDENPDMSQDEAVKIVQKMIDKAVSPIREELAIQKTFKNPEDMQYAAEVASLVRENPTIPWNVALDAIKFRKSGERLKEEGRKEAYSNIQQKQSGQSDSIQSGQKRQVDIAQIVSDKSIPFSEVQKIMRETFRQ